MKLSRKRKRELRKLRSSAEELWQEQQGVLEHASAVLRGAGKQANALSHEHVVPHVKHTYEDRVRPTVEKGVHATRSAASSAKHKVVDDVVPALVGVAGSALTVLQATKSLGSKFDADALNKKLKDFSASLKPEPPKKSGPGFGTYALIAVGVLALAGVAYAAWQTFRADDDLWIADDEPEVTGSTNPSDVPPTPTA